MEHTEKRLMETRDKRSRRIDRVAILGTPGSGRTTLFDALTCTSGEEGLGGFFLNGRQVDLELLPGMTGSGADAGVRVTQVVCAGSFDLVINMIDATDVARGMELTMHLLGLSANTVVLLNRMDKAKEGGMAVDAYGLSLALGVPVIPLVAVDGESVRRAVIDIEGVCESLGNNNIRPCLDETASTVGACAKIQSICNNIIRRRE